MKLWSLTAEKAQQLRTDLSALAAQLEELRGQTAESMWQADLAALHDQLTGGAARDGSGAKREALDAAAATLQAVKLQLLALATRYQGPVRTGRDDAVAAAAAPGLEHLAARKADLEYEPAAVGRHVDFSVRSKADPVGSFTKIQEQAGGRGMVSRRPGQDSVSIGYQQHGVVGAECHGGRLFASGDVLEKVAAAHVVEEQPALAATRHRVAAGRHGQ